MVGEASGDDHRPLRLSDQRPVASRDLGGGVDRLAAARAEEDRGVVERGELGDPFGEREGRRVCVVAEHVVRREDAQLVRHRVRDLRSAVTDVREPEPRGRVEVLVAVCVPEAATLSAREHELVPIHLPHRGEWVPEARRGSGRNRHAATLSVRRTRHPDKTCELFVKDDPKAGRVRLERELTRARRRPVGSLRPARQGSRIRRRRTGEVRAALSDPFHVSRELDDRFRGRVGTAPVPCRGPL